uniref:Centromere protein E n=1 Tax=Malurus cyaneus samueli TaxID=2593467 RepID=A0A8C5T471_9PASS
MHWRSENNTVSDVNGTKIFSYDRVFHSSDNTQQLYVGVAVPIIQSAVQGYNGTIFAYGQTASGKTYTMMGNEDSMGIIPKAIQDVFKIICEIPDREFLLRVSYMEIYNETITDLLCDSRKKKPLGIREDVNRNIYVEDLIEEVVVSPEQVMEWIRKGERNRHYGETKMNEHSSRSHTIFRMIIESRERSDPSNANCDGAVMVSHLVNVYLRPFGVQPYCVRLKEGCNINRSLFILGQVIKKLCDDPSGFINYRDSKLTRILQNSLGGNAKTVIICTITPVSFDETLSTLQFANTAKGMKNTPKVNEVLDDDALLKRYRKEILDLKKQLEEVSSKTHIHAIEKDQLAQLLEEKNSLQKVQEDRIRNLTEMLVTSASFASKQNIKAKRRRRVTWAPGKINQGNVNFFEDFENAMATETKKMKLSLPAVPDVEDCRSVLNFLEIRLTLQQQLLKFLVLLFQDIAVNEVNTLQANFNNLVLENEQLKSEINEMKEKLKEKKEIDEFEALERQTQKDLEIQLMHEITNLKNLVSNAEVYNQELEVEINSKLEQLKEKENKIKILQNRVEELQKAGLEKKETSFSLIEEIQQLNKSLFDSEAVALDAKKESAFLRSENLELKEKMNELLNNYNQMQKDVQLYQSQIEAGKNSYRKMQADLQRELQSLFQENTRLTSLMEGKVPKDLLSHVELEKKAADLKGELENALKENALLQKQVNELSEFQSLPNTVEMQKKEILEKCEELHLLKLENEKLLSEVADNETRLKHMTEEIEKSKDSLADAQLKYVKSDQEYVALKQLHEEIEQKYIAASESNEQMKLQIECLSKEAQESKTTLDEVKLELSSKMKELEEKTQKLNEMEQLKEEERNSELRLEAKDLEIQAILQQLTECREEIKTLTQERDDLKQKEESLQNERDHVVQVLMDLIVSKNSEMQEELRCTRESLGQHQEMIVELKGNISEKENQLWKVQEELKEQSDELQQKVRSSFVKITETSGTKRANHLPQENCSLQEKLDSLLLEKEEFGEGAFQAQRRLHEMEEAKANEHQGESERMETTDVTPKPLDSQDVNTQTEREDEDLKMQLENLQNEKDQLRETLQETISKNSEMQEELRCTRESLGQHQEMIVELKGNISEKENQLWKAQEELKEQSDELQQKMQEELRCTRESLGQHQEMIVELKGNISEKENQLWKVQEELKEQSDELQQKVRSSLANEHQGESERMETTDVTPKPLDSQDVNTQTEREDEDLKMQLENLQNERDQLRETLQETISKNSEMQEELRCTRESLGQHQEMIVELKGNISEKENQLWKVQEELKEQSDELQQKVRSSLVRKTESSVGFGSPYLLQTSVCSAKINVVNTLFITKYVLVSVCAKKEQYHTTVNKYKMKLLEEKRKQDHLQSQTQYLRKIYLKQDEASSQELNNSEGLQNFHLDAESILKDVSEMEHELLCIEAELQQQESARKETIQFWEACSGTHCDAEELKEVLKKQNERLLQVSKIWTPKVKVKLNVIESEIYFVLVLYEGGQLYKEQIDHLKTQLVKFQILTQSQVPLTCGGGSGIVQSTQILVLKSEQAKLQKENLCLKEQNDRLRSGELQLKEELKKWKERALKLREQSSRETTRETISKSPKKTVSYFFKKQMPSPSKETASQEIVTQDLSKPLPLTCPTNFFDNSNLGMLTGT